MPTNLSLGESMDTRVAANRDVAAAEAPDFDAIVIGAGVAGLYQLYRLRELGGVPYARFRNKSRDIGAARSIDAADRGPIRLGRRGYARA